MINIDVYLLIYNYYAAKYLLLLVDVRDISMIERPIL
jgi:hypothetical protein